MQKPVLKVRIMVDFPFVKSCVISVDEDRRDQYRTDLDQIQPNLGMARLHPASLK